MTPAEIDTLIARLKNVEPATFKKAGITQASIQTLLLSLPRMTKEEVKEVFIAVRRLVNADLRARASHDFLSFVRLVWPKFIEGAHIRQMAKAFQDIAEGRSSRLIINMPPRHSKSEMASYMFPAWFIGRYPDKKLMIGTHTAPLAQGFGAKIRNLINSHLYQSIFPGVALAEDTKAKGLWRTNQGGEFFAAGVGSAIAGRGADLFIMDDPYSEQDARAGEYNPEIWESVWTWYQQGPRQRLQPNGAIIIVHTRWSLQDITGRLLRREGTREKNPWKVIRFPALLPSGSQLWPEFWPLDQIMALKEEMEPAYWEAQYQQDPTAEVVAIIKREYWQLWDKELPEAKFIVTTVDTAHSISKKNDYTALTTWAVFENKVEEEVEDCILMVEAIRDRVEYPELKTLIFRHYAEMKPDLIIIEAKAAGMPLIQELQRMGLPVIAFVPTVKTGDKIARLRQVADVFKAKRVFRPDRQWAREVIEEVASFPKGEHDDFVDTVSMAIKFLKDGEYVVTDERPEEETVEEREMEYY